MSMSADGESLIITPGIMESLMRKISCSNWPMACSLLRTRKDTFEQEGK